MKRTWSESTYDQTPKSTLPILPLCSACRSCGCYDIAHSECEHGEKKDEMVWKMADEKRDDEGGNYP